MDIINVKIKYSYLGTDESGVPSMQIGFEGKNGSTYATDKISFVDASFVKNILNTLEVRSWEELPRKFARIKLEGKHVIAIGNLIEDKWMEMR